MAIAVERRPQVVARRRNRRRAQRGIAHLLTYLGLLVALVFFLGPFFWIVTTSLKGNEDFFTFPPVWITSEPSLRH
jgi:multiple sugar transport system permease protein